MRHPSNFCFVTPWKIMYMSSGFAIYDKDVIGWCTFYQLCHTFEPSCLLMLPTTAYCRTIGTIVNSPLLPLTPIAPRFVRRREIRTESLHILRRTKCVVSSTIVAYNYALKVVFQIRNVFAYCAYACMFHEPVLIARFTSWELCTPRQIGRSEGPLEMWSRSDAI